MKQILPLITALLLASTATLHAAEPKWNGQQLIPESYLARATTPSQINDHYGFFWWVDDFTVGGKTYHSFQGRGAGGQFIFMFPELDLVAVITSHNKGMGDTLRSLPERIIPAFIQN